LDDRERALRIEAIERSALGDGRRVRDETRAALGRRIGQWGDVLAIATDSNPSILLNRVVGVGLGQPADDRLLDTIAAHYGGREHAVQIAPFAEPADLGARLEARGYGHYFSWIKWWRDASPAARVTSPLRITRATAADAELVGDLATRVFDQPPANARATAEMVGAPGWRHFLAWENATPIAIAAVFVVDEGAWFGVTGTLPEFRRRGAQQALLAARIEAAREAGCRILTVETGPDPPERPNPSYHNVQRAGFRIAYERPSWVYPDPGRRDS
jgi:GNAT superfamily N-acetyltransferase